MIKGGGHTVGARSFSWISLMKGYNDFLFGEWPGQF